MTKDLGSKLSEPDLNKRLTNLSPTIEQLISIGGTAGASLGVLHHGKIVYTADFGYRDIGKKVAPNSDTVYPICSFTKAIISAALAALVEDGHLTWDTKVKDIITEFHTKDDILGEHTTITDLLAHRTGMSTSNYWLGSQNNILIAREDSLKFLNNQQAVKPFRGQWQYNNLGYEIAGLVIEKLTNGRWDNTVRSKLLDPLGLHRTFATASEQDDNTAKAYGVLDDGTATPIDSVKAGADTFGGANGGMRSSVKDLLTLYRGLMTASKDQFERAVSSTPDSPFKQVRELLSAKIPMSNTSFHEQSYAFGWARAQTPATMGAIGLNPTLMPDGMPVVGKGSPSRLIVYHQGSLPGSLGAVNLLPETQSAVVVLTNTLALNDGADWIGQLVLEALLNVNQKNDYVQAARTSVKQALGWHKRVSDELKEHQTPATSSKNLNDYVGTYVNSIDTMKLEVSLENDVLNFALQGLDSEKYSLQHYEHDVFSWLQPRNELAKRGKFTHQKSSYYLLRFVEDGNGNIDTVNWAHDPNVPDGENFHRVH